MEVTQLRSMTSAEAQLPPALAHLMPRVDLSLLAGDTMFAGDAAHYLRCGASAVNAMTAALLSTNSAPPASILDFGAGAGRVTRWLRAAFPGAALSASDLPGPSHAFLEQTFGAKTWLSGTDANALAAPERYDLIWAGSVITHLREADAAALLHKLYSWVKPNGLVIASFHGRFARQHGDAQPDRYIAAASWRAITAQCDSSQYGYADYDPHHPGYGVSLCTLSWIAALAGKLSGARIAYVAEQGWDGHQDVVAFQRPI
jgi:SAM-dependent methyltransferase